MRARRHRPEEGVVEEVGAGVDRITVGDRVAVPFNIASGGCRNCTQGWTPFCLPPPNARTAGRRCCSSRTPEPRQA
jgi:threonine dehydrogenase-like Zn-dependent dehydrogenase